MGKNMGAKRKIQIHNNKSRTQSHILPLNSINSLAYSQRSIRNGVWHIQINCKAI